MAIRCEGVGKRYRIGKQLPYRTLRDTLMETATAPLRWLRARGDEAAEKQTELWALKDVSLEVKHGEVLGVIGRNGSGKSTLARLLLRFFDPDSGQISFGGVDLRDLDSTQLYRHIGFVLQDVRLLHASVRDNIALGRPDATQDEVEAARVLLHLIGIAGDDDLVRAEA